ncbi:GIY-YIG nuclease family protein [Priestia megaterium]
MSFKYEITDREFDKVYKVWDYKTIKAECNKPGVYVLSDIKGGTLYVGESESVGGRIFNHIKGFSTEAKKLGFANRICTIKVFLFEKTSQGKTDMKMCEHWTKFQFPTYYSKDDYNHNFKEIRKYNADKSTEFENWHEYHDEVSGEIINGKEYQEKVIASGLKL